MTILQQPSFDPILEECKQRGKLHTDISSWSQVWDFWNLDELFDPKGHCRYLCLQGMDRQHQTALGLSVWKPAGDTVDLLYMFVPTSLRRSGLGHWLLEHSMRMVAKQLPRCSQALLEVRPSNKAAIAVYERAGFKQVHVRKGYYSDGEDALILQAPLTHNKAQ